MRKSHYILALAPVLGTGLLACGNYNGTHGLSFNGAAVRTNSTVTVTVAVSGDTSELKIRQEEADAFMKTHPNIQVKWVNLGPDRLQKTLTLIAGGNPPDIFYINDWTKPLAEKGALMSLDSLIKSDTSFHLNQYYPALIHALQYNGQLYGLPQEVSPMAMYYNKDLFKKAGIQYPTDSWTQTQFLADAKKLTVPSKKQYGFLMGNWAGFWGGFLARNGGGIYSDNGTKSGLNTPGSLTGLKAEYQLVVKDHSSPSPAAQQALGEGPDALFRNQQVAMISAGMWLLPEFKQQALPFHWDVVPMPKAVNQQTESGILNWSISAQTKHLKESWEVLKFFTGPIGGKIVAENDMALPGIKDQADLQIVSKTHFPSNVDAFIKSAPLVTTQEQDSPKSAEVDTLIGAQLDLMLEGKQSPEVTQKNIVNGMNKILK